MFDVIVAGELNVDIIMNGMTSLPVIGKEIVADAMTVTLGSSSAIFASNLSTLGSKVAFAGKIGDDKFGEVILEMLKSKQVDVQNIVTTAGLKTGATVVLNFDQDRANVTYPGAMAFFGMNDIDDRALGQAKHLHVSSIFLQHQLRKDLPELLRKARMLGLTISIDPQWDPAEGWELGDNDVIDCIDLFMPNAEECRRITGTASLAQAFEAIKRYKAATVIKCGSDGAYLWNGSAMYHQPAFVNKSVVDSVGAGDSFDAGFIHGYLQNRAWQECLKLGAVMGALNTTSAGGTGAFESLEKVRSKAQSVFNYSF